MDTQAEKEGIRNLSQDLSPNSYLIRKIVYKIKLKTHCFIHERHLNNKQSITFTIKEAFRRKNLLFYSLDSTRIKRSDFRVYTERINI